MPGDVERSVSGRNQEKSGLRELTRIRASYPGAPWLLEKGDGGWFDVRRAKCKRCQKQQKAAAFRSLRRAKNVRYNKGTV